ncbi:MAG: alpha/beta hydrolase [Acidobacteriia bacterium]|nr:alpha/beta hydrolase [Terriglobia bacterium]
MKTEASFHPGHAAEGTPSWNQQIRLRDGRALGFAEFGDPHGKPVFYFHGFPGSRLEAQVAAGLASRHEARIIAVDRPGYGLSEFKPDRSIGEWPADILEIADLLRLDRFTVLGISGGGPYAAACALKIPDRLISVGLVSGMGPPEALQQTGAMRWMNRAALFLACHTPALVEMACAGIAMSIRRRPERVVSRLMRLVSPVDKEVLSREEFQEALCRSFREAVRLDLRGPGRDLVLYARPWDFQLQDIRMPVNLWHGEHDWIVPPSMGRFQQNAIPNCRAIFFEQEGHFSLIMKHMKDIFDTLTS